MKQQLEVKYQVMNDKSFWHSFIEGKGTNFTVGIYKDFLLCWNSYDQELFELDLKNWRWKLLNQVRGIIPGIRDGHTMIIHNDSLYIIGGSKGLDLCSDICKFDIQRKEWSYRTDTRFQVRLHSAVVYQNNILVFGGRVEFGKLSSDIVEISAWMLPIPILFSALQLRNLDDVTFLYK
jgi:hypothetical protein